MALTNATTLADYGAGIGTQGATLKVDATNKRVGVGTDSPAGPEGSLQVGTGITFFGNTGIVSAIGGKFSGDFTVGGTLTYEDVANIDAVGIITAQSGVSIADSIFHTGDTNTAIRFPAADTFTVETGGSEALRVDSSQNTTFGTTSESSTSVNITASTSGSCLLSFNDSNSGQGGIRYFHSTDHMQFHTADSERARIDSSGNLGLGESSSIDARLHVNSGTDNTTLFLESTDGDVNLGMADNAGSCRLLQAGGNLRFRTGGNANAFGTGDGERMVLDSSGRLVIGNTSAETSFRTPKVQIKGTDNNTGLLIHNTNSNADGGSLILAHSRGTGSINSGDILGDLVWCANDGTDIATRAALIRGSVDGAPGSNDMPGRLQFYTTPDGSENPSERMRIHNGGTVTIPNGITLGTTITSTNAANTLDDYEEGTWTPIDNSANLTLSTADGRYVKIGSLVHCWGRIEYPTTSDTTATSIGGFPFTNLHVNSNPNYSGNIAITDYGDTNILPMVENQRIQFRNFSNGSLTNANLSGKFIYVEFRLRT